MATDTHYINCQQTVVILLSVNMIAVQTISHESISNGDVVHSNDSQFENQHQRHQSLVKSICETNCDIGWEPTNRKAAILIMIGEVFLLQPQENIQIGSCISTESLFNIWRLNFLISTLIIHE